MKLSPDLREFVALLNSRKVRYLVVGGHAVAFHGFPRYTGDVDFFIAGSPDNAERITEVIREFGFGSVGFQTSDFLEPGVVLQLGRPPNRIDILTSIDGVAFDEAWASREEAALDGLPVPFIGKQCLIQNKRASGRPQDLADIQRLDDAS
ncbi:MAG: nucleotidyltransferase [Verrucomicrobiota bacterium]